MLLNYNNEEFLVIHPSGSKGDQLIVMGMEKKLKELNIRYRLFHLRLESSFFNQVSNYVHRKLLNNKLKVLKKESLRVISSATSFINNQMNRKRRLIPNTSSTIFLLRGGAYLNDIWKEYHIMHTVFQVVHNKPYSKIIIAPQSFYFSSTHFSSFLSKIKNEIHIFCREKYSYDLLNSMVFPRNVHIYLSPDTSLYLSKEDFQLQDKYQREAYILIAPRKDRESIVMWKIDKMISSKTKILFGDIIHLPKFNDYVNIIWGARQIYTDRLHNAILAAILGKETYLYPNSYYKNKGVYEFSLKKFPNVKFVDSYKFLGLNACS
ncbi:MAG: polysaccharide pyruvyl transferase family protein [Candidatus Aenigmatarchaeota archaeon]